jgi:hypothetical protein
LVTIPKSFTIFREGRVPNKDKPLEISGVIEKNGMLFHKCGAKGRG